MKTFATLIVLVGRCRKILLRYLEVKLLQFNLVKKKSKSGNFQKLKLESYVQLKKYNYSVTDEK